MKSMKVALYVRVSRLDQNPDNQIVELRRYVRARDWKATEFIERGISGSKDRRPQLDAMMKDVKRKRFDAVVCWKLDRLGRDMRHLINLLDELRALDVGLVTLGEGLDTTTPAGRMAFGIFAVPSQSSSVSGCANGHCSGSIGPRHRESVSDAQ